MGALAVARVPSPRQAGGRSVTEQTAEQRIENRLKDADELDRRADAIPASEAAVRTAEAGNLRAAARRARREAEDLARRP